MDNAVLQLLRDQHKDVMGRFDKIEAAHDAHLQEDREVHKLVERHALYINIAFLGLPLLAGAVIKKLGFPQ